MNEWPKRLLKVAFLSIRSNSLVYLCSGSGQGEWLGRYSIPPHSIVRHGEKGFLLVE